MFLVLSEYISFNIARRLEFLTASLSRPVTSYIRSWGPVKSARVSLKSYQLPKSISLNVSLVRSKTKYLRKQKTLEFCSRTNCL